MQLHSKSRFIAAQFSALLKNGLWLKTAAHANRMAQKLANEASLIPGIKITQKVEGNEIFAIIPRDKLNACRKNVSFIYGMKTLRKSAGYALSIPQKAISLNL